MRDKAEILIFMLVFGGVSALFLWSAWQKEDPVFLLVPSVFLMVSVVVTVSILLPSWLKQGVWDGVVRLWFWLWSRVTFGFFGGLDSVRNQFHEPVVEPTRKELDVAREVAELLRAGDIHAILAQMPIQTWTSATYDAVLIELWRPKFTADSAKLDTMLAQMWLHAPQDTIMRADLLEHISRHGQQDCLRTCTHTREHGDVDRSGGLGAHFDQVLERLEERVGPLSEAGGELSVVHDASSAGGLSLDQDSRDDQS